MSANLPYYIKSKYPIELKTLPVVKSRKQFLDECRAAWEHEYWTIERIVDSIERLMKEHNVTYLMGHVTTTINGTNVRTARDYFEDDIFNNVDRPSDLDRIINKHLNFSNSNLC